MILVTAPLLAPLATAMFCAATQSKPRLQQWLSSCGASVHLLCSLALVWQVSQHGTITITAGNWPLPFGIELVADRLGVALVLISALMLTVTLLWQTSDVDTAPSHPTLLPLVHGLVAGSGAAFLTADLFNLYVWFELALICALGLLSLGGSLRQLDAALKYFAINLVGTLLLLAAIAMLYAKTGHLNYNALAGVLGWQNDGMILTLSGMLVLAFLIKSAAFPFFAWLPASYHTLPTPILALFSALLSKIGICALIRILSSVFHPVPDLLTSGLGLIAILSMITGVLGAAYHWDLRRILAFHSISQVGYMLLALALTSPAGDAAAIFFAVHHSLVKAGLFLTAGLIYRFTGHFDLRRIGGLYAAKPGLSVLFLVLALSLVGIPPLSGFWGKYLIVKECMTQGAYLWAGIALLVGALTFYSMLKIWLQAFWKPHPEKTWRPLVTTSLLPAQAGLSVLMLVVLWMGLLPEKLVVFVTNAAHSLGGGLP